VRPHAGLSATSAGTCASRWDIADRLRDLGLHGVTTAPRHCVTQDDLLPALEGEEAAAALWQHLGDKVGANRPRLQLLRMQQLSTCSSVVG
jgi:hypothetical protein